jgi:hypothetical protein
MAARISPMRTFDPVAVGNYEADVWIAYYRRRWRRFLASAVGLVRSGFALSRWRTLRGAWLVLRANQLWAPYPDNDPDGARRCMRAFYALVAEQHGETFDLDEAARLEINWWRAHRELQREDPDRGMGELIDALAALYSHVYGVPAETVRTAAEGRAAAMVISDQWVADGCDPDSPVLSQERKELVRGYAELRAAVS